MAAIDAHCESTSALLIERIKAENLININSGGETRIKEIALDLCNETEKRVQEQHIEDKEKALENWFLNPIPKKQEIADSRQSANAAEHYAWIFYCAWL